MNKNLLILFLISITLLGCSKENKEDTADKQNETQIESKIEEDTIFVEQEDDFLIEESRKVIEKLASGITTSVLEEYNQIMNEVFVDVEFYSNPEEMDPNVQEVITTFSNEKLSKLESHYYYTVDLVFEFKMKDGTTIIAEESPDSTFNFTVQDGLIKILSIQ